MVQRAIIEHHERAKDLDDFYAVMRQDYRRSSFAYGRKKIEEGLKQTLAEIPDGGGVLDIGCGTGEQLRFCHDLGFEVIGLEPAANMRAIAKANNPGLPIHDGVVALVVFLEVYPVLERTGPVSQVRGTRRSHSAHNNSFFIHYYPPNNMLCSKAKIGFKITSSSPT